MLPLAFFVLVTPPAPLAVAWSEKILSVLATIKTAAEQKK